MISPRRPWKEELAIVDRTMRAISAVSDPEDFVEAYWNGIGELIPFNDYVSLSRRNEQPPFYRITRSSRFEEHLNPWKFRDRLPLLSGGVLGEVMYANAPVIINDLPARLKEDDPGKFFIEGFASLIGFPHYDGGEAMNYTCLLIRPGVEIDPSIIPMLHWQSGLFGRGTQNLVLRNELREAMGALDRELKTVGQMQRSLLPAELPLIPGFEVAAFYETSARAGGDYYDFFPLANGGWGIFIADVSGHGTPAAVLMAITHAIAHAHPGTHTPPDQLLTHLNDRLTRSYTRNGTFVTAFYAVLDRRTLTLTYSTAGHNPPRVVRDGRIIPLDHNSALPLGIIADERYGQATITLEQGDLLLLYTDGITETAAPMDESGTRELFGVERLDRLLLDCRSTSAAECIARIRAAVGEFSANAPRADDQTLIALRCSAM